MRTSQPEKIMVKMKNCLVATGTTSMGAFSVICGQFLPLRLRDPQQNVANQCFPENFVAYAGIYEKYIVHGVNITCHVISNTANENDSFYSVYQGVPDGDTPFAPSSLITVNSMLQEKDMRRKFIIGTGEGSSPSTQFHSSGYYDMKYLMADNKPNYTSWEGEVTATGTAVSDPVQQPQIFHTIHSPQFSGFPDAESIVFRYWITFYVEWFSRRRAIELTRDEES